MALPFSYNVVSRRGYALLALSCMLVGLAAPGFVHAQGEMIFTIAPPLFQLSLQPGETWSSSISVVNQNPYELTLYAEPVQFEPAGEAGRPAFIQSEDGTGPESASDSSNVASWVTVPLQAVSIPSEQTHQLPVVISVPEDAPPGGHYAAILIGNRPPQGASGDTSVSVASSIASLIFLTVAGDVVEDGRIRDFVTEEYVYDRPEARLSLRFENQGNVHLLPQGDITIFNMWGKKRGYVPINQGTNYGNVLPGSMRKYAFSWSADTGIWDIGRYRAEATLGYGREAKQFATATIYFYVLPIVPLLQMLAGIVFFIYFVGWAIRAYIRRALALAAQESGLGEQTTPPESEADATAAEMRQRPVQAAPVAPPAPVGRPEPAQPAAAPELNLKTLIRPIQSGFVDLRSVGDKEEQALARDAAIARSSNAFTIGAFLREYKMFFVFVIIVALTWFGISVVVSDVLTYERSYEVREEREDGTEVQLFAE